MLRGKLGAPELVVVSIILFLIGLIIAAVWLTRKSKRSASGEISRPSMVLVVLGFLWCWLVVAGMYHSPLISSYTFGGVLAIAIVPAAVALGMMRLGKHKMDWNVSARWFFWSMFALSTLLSVAGIK